MKIWKVDYFKSYSNTDLEDKLNDMQINNKCIKEIIYNPKVDEYEIIYTIEDEIMEIEK